MSKQLDDPKFDHANDEWIGDPARWDQISSLRAAPEPLNEIKRVPPKKRAPAITGDEVRAVVEAFGSASLSMTYERSLRKLHEEGLVHLTVEQVTMVAELGGIRATTREWVGVPSPIRRLCASQGAKVAGRRRK